MVDSLESKRTLLSEGGKAKLGQEDHQVSFLSPQGTWGIGGVPVNFANLPPSNITQRPGPRGDPFVGHQEGHRRAPGISRSLVAYRGMSLCPVWGGL